MSGITKITFIRRLIIIISLLAIGLIWAYAEFGDYVFELGKRND